MTNLRAIFLGLCGLTLSACATTSGPDAPVDVPDVVADPVTRPPAPPRIPPPPPPTDERPDEPIYEEPDSFDDLRGWNSADPSSALSAFARSCEALLQGEPDKALNPNLPQYGTYADWRTSCLAASLAETDADSARDFFETFFEPLSLSSEQTGEGLLTGYYEPEVEVRVKPDTVFSEPILARPDSKAVQMRPRAQLNARSSRVIAYGRPIDVFFLQIQGSGRLRYADGRTLRAAYGGNNGKAYTSIGRVLVQRGDLTLNQSAKRNIEAWMVKAGPKATRALMNENARYIFFAEQRIEPGEGPRGAMQVPLTSMGSVAIDPRYHPYGTLAWLETRLPQRARDYTGTETGLLVVAQDTGSAIRGPLRGDLFFGSGSEAGARAGVMKHPVRWTVLVPKGLVGPTPIAARATTGRSTLS